jgi:hypothetical protein
MNPMLNRIFILGWPIVAAFILVPVLKAIDSPPNLTVVVFAIVGMIAGALIGGKLDIPEKWLKTEEERRSED